MQARQASAFRTPMATVPFAQFSNKSDKEGQEESKSEEKKSESKQK